MKSLTQEPLLSIIVISKDDPVGLQRTLESIRAQTCREFEVVVVLKGRSTDVAMPASLRDCTTVRIQTGSGISAAFNEGIAAARGRWINFLNGGDAYRDQRSLFAVASELSKHSAVLVTCRARDGVTGVLIPRDGSFRKRRTELVSHQATFFSRRLFSELGGYSPAYRIRMDFEWMLRVPSGTPVTWIDSVLISFAGNGVSSIKPVMSCWEELNALRQHQRGVWRMLALLILYLPWRTTRAAWRRLVPREPRRHAQRP